LASRSFIERAMKKSRVGMQANIRTTKKRKEVAQSENWNNRIFSVRFGLNLHFPANN
jgi:predicted AAA+ superfamily ATPase